MDVLIFYIIFSAFLISIMIFIFRKVSKVHTKVNTYNFGEEFNDNKHKHIRQKNYTTNIIVYIFLILTAIASLIVYGTNVEVEDSYVSYFTNGFQFQIASSILFIILSFLNPFILFPEKMVETIKKKNTFLEHVITNDKKSFNIRMLLSVSIIGLFVYKKWLVFSPFFSDFKLLQGINIFMVLFICKNIYTMKKHPIDFFIMNVIKLINGVLYVKIFVFVLIPLAPFTMLTLHLLEFDENQFPFFTMLFIVFNMILVLLEMKKKKEVAIKK